MRWTAYTLSVGLILGLSGLAYALSLDLRLSPSRVEIGAFFEGTEVEVAGQIPAGATAVVELLGQTTTEELLRKGRRAGLWMTVGEIKIHNVPCLYLLLSSSPEIPELAAGETPWGFEALERQAHFTGQLAAGEPEKFFQEFLDLKKSEGLYQLMPGALKISQPQEGWCSWRGAFRLPARVPPGRYKVKLTAIRDGRLLEQRNHHLEVKMVGFPALLATLAYRHGAFYGVLAVVIAIATGFLMGLLFKGKAAH